MSSKKNKRSVSRPAPVPPSGPEGVLPWPFLAAVGGVWAFIVFFHYYKAFPIRWQAVGPIVSNVASGLSHLSGRLLLEHLATFFCVGAVFASCVAMGGLTLKLLRWRAHDSLEGFVFSAGLGAGVAAYIMLFLAVVGGLYKSVAWVLVGLCAAGLVYVRLRKVGDPPPAPARARVRWTFLDKCAWGVFGFQVLHNFIGGLTPVVFYDSLVYHLNGPTLNIVNHRLMEMPYNFFVHMPAAVSYLYTFAMLLKDEVAAKFTGFCTGLLCCAALYSFSRRFLTARAGLWAMTIFYTLYHVGYISSACGNDVGLTLFSVLAVYAFVVWCEENAILWALSPAIDQPARPHGSGAARAWLWVSALAVGFAMGTKYTAAHVPAAMFLTLLIFKKARRVPWSVWTRAVVVVVAIGSAVLAPWLIKNAVYKKNPVFPLMNNVFPMVETSDRDHLNHFIGETLQFDIHSVKDYVRLPWDVTMGIRPNAPVFTPLFLAFLPLLFFFRKNPPALRWLIPLTGLLILFWSFSTTMIRYLMPAYPWMALLLAHWFVNAAWPAFLMSCLRALALVVCFGNVVDLMMLTYQLEGWKTVMGLESRHDYLSRSHPTYPPPAYAGMRYINENLPPDARVVLLGEPRATYMRRDYVVNSQFDLTPFVIWARQSKDAADFRARLARERVTHMLLSVSEARRLKSYGILKWDGHGLAVMEEFWKRYVREVFSWDEKYQDQIANRVLVYELLSEEAAALPHAPPPNYLSDIARAP